jgi:hypothetical protein
MDGFLKWETMTPEQKTRINIPNAHIIANLHACYTGETISSPYINTYFSEYRYASSGANTYAYYPGQEGMQQLLGFNNMTEASRHLRKIGKDSRENSQQTVDINRKQLSEIYTIIISTIEEANNEEGTIESKQQFFIHSIDIYFDFLKDQNYYEHHIADSLYAIKDFLETNINSFIKISRPTPKKTRKITPLYKRLKTKCINVIKLFEKIDKEIIKSLNNRYRKPIGIPRQHFEGKHEGEEVYDRGVAVKIIDGSLLDELSRMYCAIHGQNFESFKTSIAKYPDGVFLRKGNELFNFINWCFTTVVEPDLVDEDAKHELIRILNVLSADFYLDPTQQVHKPELLQTDDIILFIKFLRHAICKAFAIPETDCLNVKFGYLSLGCNVYYGKKSEMEDYDIDFSQSQSQSASDDLGGGGLYGGKTRKRSRKTRKYQKK